MTQNTETNPAAPAAAMQISYSVERAAEVTDIGRSYIYLAIKHGELATLKLGKRRLILHEDLVAWLNRQRVAA